MTVPVSELEPVPITGCGVCGALGKERDEARRAGDRVDVAKINAEIRNHPHGRRAPGSRRRPREEHVMKRHPDAETTATARCVHPDCTWEAPPTGSASQCADWCMEHTGRTTHGIFVRTFSEVAVVVRAEVHLPTGQGREQGQGQGPEQDAGPGQLLEEP